MFATLALGWVLPLLTVSTGDQTEASAADRSFIQQVHLSVATPSGFTAAIADTPTFSFFDHRLNVGIGGRFSSFFGNGKVVFPNGNAALIAAGAKDTLTVERPLSYALNLMFAIAVRLFDGLEAGMNIDLVGVGFGPDVTGQYAGFRARFSRTAKSQPLQTQSFSLWTPRLRSAGLGILRGLLERLLGRPRGSESHEYRVHNQQAARWKQ